MHGGPKSNSFWKKLIAMSAKDDPLNQNKGK